MSTQTLNRSYTRKPLITTIPTKPLQPKAKTPVVDLNRILDAAIVSITGWFYRVDFGPEIAPRYHHVGKDKRCSCALGADCPAVSAVADYLKAGGERASEPPHGFYPVAPALCPVCGAKALSAPTLGSKQRGAGWVCSKEGERHYWQDRTRILKEAFAANPWLFPPVVIREGKQMYARDGIKPGDQVLSEGILRDDAFQGGKYGYLE